MRIIAYGYKLTSVAFDKTQASINEPEDLEVVLKVLREENKQKNLNVNRTVAEADLTDPG